MCKKRRVQQKSQTNLLSYIPTHACDDLLETLKLGVIKNQAWSQTIVWLYFSIKQNLGEIFYWIRFFFLYYVFSCQSLRACEKYCAAVF